MSFQSSALQLDCCYRMRSHQKVLVLMVLVSPRLLQQLALAPVYSQTKTMVQELQEPVLLLQMKSLLQQELVLEYYCCLRQIGNPP